MAAIFQFLVVVFLFALLSLALAGFVGVVFTLLDGFLKLLKKMFSFLEPKKQNKETAGVAEQKRDAPPQETAKSKFISSVADEPEGSGMYDFLKKRP